MNYYTIYKVLASNEVQVPDMDGCLCDKEELFFEDMMTSKTKATAKAQSLFAKGADWVRVIEYLVTEKHCISVGHIYNKYYQK